MVCDRGLFYNKATLLEHLLAKSLAYEFRHIRKLSQLIELSRECLTDTGMVKCAISGEVLSERDQFRLKSCGCVVSKAALKEVGSSCDGSSEECVVCGRKVEKEVVL